MSVTLQLVFYAVIAMLELLLEPVLLHMHDAAEVLVFCTMIVLTAC